MDLFLAICVKKSNRLGYTAHASLEAGAGTPGVVDARESRVEDARIAEIEVIKRELICHFSQGLEGAIGYNAGSDSRRAYSCHSLCRKSESFTQRLPARSDKVLILVSIAEKSF